MKTTIFALFAILFVAGCSSPNNSASKPSQFTPTEQRVIVVGCEELKEEIEKHNEANPNDQKVADC
jgi:uncharacterized protein YcfL